MRLPTVTAKVDRSKDLVLVASFSMSLGVHFRQMIIFLFLVRSFNVNERYQWLSSLPHRQIILRTQSKDFEHRCSLAHSLVQWILRAQRWSGRCSSTQSKKKGRKGRKSEKSAWSLQWDRCSLYTNCVPFFPASNCLCTSMHICIPSTQMAFFVLSFRKPSEQARKWQEKFKCWSQKEEWRQREVTERKEKSSIIESADKRTHTRTCYTRHSSTNLQTMWSFESHRSTQSMGT